MIVCFWFLWIFFRIWVGLLVFWLIFFICFFKFGGKYMGVLFWIFMLWDWFFVILVFFFKGLIIEFLNFEGKVCVCFCFDCMRVLGLFVVFEGGVLLLVFLLLKLNDFLMIVIVILVIFVFFCFIKIFDGCGGFVFLLWFYLELIFFFKLGDNIDFVL